MKKPKAKREVARLVSKLDSLTKREFKKYDEENTKKDFILPLFRALGWAIEDRREVTAEDKVSRRRVDYAFRIEGIPKFFLEAKRLKADLDNPKYAWQAINYAWTKGVTWAVLTDFEGLKVFNAQWKGDNLLYNRFIEIAYTEYLERFDELWLLSRESFEKGLLDIEAEKVAKKAKREPVGKQLFDDLIVWRHRLYKQLKGWNDGYSAAEIDEAVQRILDRLIFIRTAEDRELEERVLLPAVREWQENGRPKELNEALVRIFRDFDNKYDSELFEVGHFCEELFCDSTTYAYVTKGLYGMRDEVPTYNFDAIDVDVLGGIYEQYLSYRQGLPEEVEEAKRRRRKKRGIYYTPKFVVQYIVENTVGRLLQGRSHDEIRKLRILDPACGSGSFLIEAFEMLARYHQELRGDVGEALVASRKREGTSPSPTDLEYDDFLERLRILRDNIYGVDLDPQAVEIARLNLLLKTLHRRALLPKLEDNIRCGNSLISGDEKELSQCFGAEWREKRHFNWEEEFPKIMEEGGFDVVIGNPPYERTLIVEEKEYYRRYYKSAYGAYDIYVLFLEKAINLLKEGGLLGFITSNKYLVSDYAKPLRQLLLESGEIAQLIDLTDTRRVFEDALVSPAILIYRRKSRPRSKYRVKKLVANESNLHYLTGERELKEYASIDEIVTPELRFEIHVDLESKTLLEKIYASSDKLGAICEVRTGIMGFDYWKLEKYITDGRPVQHSCRIATNSYIEPYGFLWGKKIKLYRKRYFTNPYLDLDSDALNENTRKLFLTPKIIVRGVARRLTGALDADGSVGLLVAVHCVVNRTQYDDKFVLALLNSALFNWIHLKKLYGARIPEGSLRYPVSFIKQLPIRRIDFENPQDVKMHDGLVALVERMLDLHKRLKDAKGEEKKNLERQIARTDRKIDGLFYQLYGITEEERKIIEGEM